MDQSVRQSRVHAAIRLAAGADIAFLVPVALDEAIDAGYENEVADVKLPAIVEQRKLQVGLNDVAGTVGGPQVVLNLGGLGKHDAEASIGALSGLHDPNFVHLVRAFRVSHESPELGVLAVPHRVSQRDDTEWVAPFHIFVVVEDRLEQLYLISQALAIREMVGDQPGRLRAPKRHDMTV